MRVLWKAFNILFWKGISNAYVRKTELTVLKISFTYSDGPNLLQVCVFGPRENSSYLTVSYEALGGLFISSSFSASLPHFPFFLFLFNPKHCFRRHHFFRNAKLVYAETQESTEDQLYIQLKKTFADRWNRSRAPSVQKRVCYPISHGESTNQDSKFVDLVDYCRFFSFLGLIFKARIFFCRSHSLNIFSSNI